MTEIREKTGVFQLTCPCCRAVLWVDGEIKEVIKSEKAKKKKGSLDDLLLKEKKRQEEFDRKFEATFELRQEKQLKANEEFRKALEKAEAGEEEE
jgi:hypothetical protein